MKTAALAFPLVACSFLARFALADPPKVSPETAAHITAAELFPSVPAPHIEIPFTLLAGLRNPAVGGERRSVPREDPVVPIGKSAGRIVYSAPPSSSLFQGGHDSAPWFPSIGIRF